MKKIAAVLLIVLFLAGLGTAGYGWSKYRNMTEKWYQPLTEAQGGEAGGSGEAAGSVAGPEKSKKEETAGISVMDPFNMMILGVDLRKGERKSRSDTMMVASVNPHTKKVTLLSIPRDTLAQIPGYGQDKFNHSMFYGGPSLVKATIEKFLHIPVSHYVAVDFAGFQKVIDSLGGIEINVDRRMKYHDPVDGTSIDLQPGLQHLNGKNALDYARFRKSDIGSASSDFDRMNRQQEIVKKVADKATDITSLPKLFTIMDILGEHVKTDFKEHEIRSLAVQFRNFSPDHIQSVEIKGKNQRIWMHGYNLWFYVVDDAEKKRVRSILNDTLNKEAVTSLPPGAPD